MINMYSMLRKALTQNIWNTQKPKNGKNLSRLSSKRSSFPVLTILNSRKPESRAPQSIMKIDATIWRPLWWPEKARVIMARTTKLVPPAKSRNGRSARNR